MSSKLKDKNWYPIGAVIVAMLVYFLLTRSALNDDGLHYEGFAEAVTRGQIDFKTFYGFQGLSFFAALVYLITKSHVSIIITSAIFSLLSIPLAYLIGKNYYQSQRAGIFYLILFLLTPYPYVTMMRGFQEAALLFFILLIIYGSLRRKLWTPLAWAAGGIVKPFSLVLLPLFAKNFLTPDVRKWIWVFLAAAVGLVYLGASYHQTGHLINNAAINSYQGNFNTGSPPPLTESFAPSLKGYLRVVANLLLSFRKIMIAPLVIILGAFALLFNKTLKWRKEIILAIILNFLLVGSLTFSFSKYLLPMTALLALASVSYLLKHRWLMPLVLLDSFFVFLPIWNYFGRNFWSNPLVFYLPLFYAFTLWIFTNEYKVQT